MSLTTEPDLPDLDQIPTQPPPPPRPAETIDQLPARGLRRPVRPGTGGGRLWRLLALILASQAALVASAVLVAVERPSLAWAVSAVASTDAFMVVCFAMVLGMVGRGR